MSPSLRALLAGLIDYAGLFPPAKLPLAEAIHNYARYRRGADDWMLGRFICPSSQLQELDAHSDLFLSCGPFAFSALSRESVATDLHAIAEFHERHGASVNVEALEVCLPAGGEAGALHDLSRQIEGTDLRVFFELPLGEDWRGTVSRQLALLREHSSAARVGVKLRCGGLKAEAFPQAEQVAFVLRAALDAGLPLKATAGLHHPFRRFDKGVQATMHGFINLFAAGALAHCRRLGEEQIRAILEDGEPAHFDFGAEGLNWQGVRASTAEIATARREAFLSFGSCSFDEPRDDLRALGWL